MRVSGPFGVDAQLQYSEDLQNWLNLGNPVTLDASPIPVSDTEADGHAHRFYRAAVP